MSVIQWNSWIPKFFSLRFEKTVEAESRPLLDRKRLRLLKEQLGGEFFAETQIHIHGMDPML